MAPSLFLSLSVCVFSDRRTDSDEVAGGLSDDAECLIWCGHLVLLLPLVLMGLLSSGVLESCDEVLGRVAPHLAIEAGPLLQCRQHVGQRVLGVPEEHARLAVGEERIVHTRVTHS